MKLSRVNLVCVMGAAIKGVEGKKEREHGQQCRNVGSRFIPLAFHTTGGDSAASLKEIKGIASAMARSNGEDPSRMVAFTNKQTNKRTKKTL